MREWNSIWFDCANLNITKLHKDEGQREEKLDFDTLIV